MSYAIIRTGGKQYPVAEGQTLRVPTISGKAGSKVDIAFRLERDEYRGESYLQARIADIRASGET